MCVLRRRVGTARTIVDEDKEANEQEEEDAECDERENNDDVVGGVANRRHVSRVGVCLRPLGWVGHESALCAATSARLADDLLHAL